jgi:hypothetical protein
MSRFKPNAWYEEQQADDASADDADTAGIVAAQERLRRWMGRDADQSELDTEGDDDDDRIYRAPQP